MSNMTKEERLKLQIAACKVRMGVIESTHGAKAGHPGGSLSAADMFTYLYNKEMRIDPANPKWADRDRFVLSKGHTAPGLYSALAYRGFFPVEDLPTLRHIDSYLQGHPNMNTVPGVDMSTGSLGQGISCAAGMAKAAKYLHKDDVRVYALLGDGEIEEGEVWEAFLFAAKYKLDNLCVMIDLNGLQSRPDEYYQGQGRQLHGEPGRLARQGPQRRGIQDRHGRAERSTGRTGGAGMSEVKKIATRDSYGAALVELAKDHPDVVVLDADLAAATKTGVFKKAYADRHFDCGIAESNMMATAAGMAAMGLVPFASSFAMFAAGRAFEQVRNSIGYPHLNVKIGATHGGISVGEDGASHQCCEDFALMRSIPGMTVLCPADDVEARAAVKAAYEHEGPVYLRFGRLAVPVFHDEASFKFEIGKGEQLTEGNDVAIFATGLEVGEALTAAEQLKNEGIQARVINLCTIKPLDEEIVVKAARECGAVVTCEEHSILGGLGEAVAAVLGEQCPTKMRRVGVKDVFGHSGPAWDLLEQFGLRSDAIVAAVKVIMAAMNSNRKFWLTCGSADWNTGTSAVILPLR